MRSTLLQLGLTFLLLQTSATVASAQASSRPAARVPATIVLSENRAGGSRFLVQRNPRAARHDVIVLAPDASENEFADAIRTLLTARNKEGDVPASKQTLRMRTTRASAAVRPGYPWAARVLSDLRRADRVDIEGVGSVRAIRIWLPAQGTTGGKRKG